MSRPELLRATEQPRLLYTIEDTMRLLSVSRARLYELMHAGEVLSVLLLGGQARRFRHSDLKAYVDALPVDTEIQDERRDTAA